MGLQGMINDLVQQCDFPTGKTLKHGINEVVSKNAGAIAEYISAAENFPSEHEGMLNEIHTLASSSVTPVLGITGTGGAGKSSMVDELVRRFLLDFPNKTIGLISVDPSKRKTGGALLGDRIRMNAIKNDRVYMRSLATRQSNLALSKHVAEAVQVLKAANYDLIVLETSGIGQSDTEIMDHSDVALYIMTPEFGAASQLEKIDMLDFADVVGINKFDKRGALDAIRDVRKQYKRNHNLFEAADESLPIFGMEGAVYLFSGLEMTVDADGKPKPNYLGDAYRYQDQRWERLPDMPWTAIAAPSPAPVTVTPARVYVLGGVDSRMVGKVPRETRVPDHMMYFDVASQAWKTMEARWPDPVVTSPAVAFAGQWWIVSGEIMAGVRTRNVWSWEPGVNP
jgi:putative protein kinase ArgK-like GTPase of G3E family